ncbi:hypothetical protein SAJA_11320 [Salinisphaera japonica YTM-1]|uniref:RND transporter n=1 Tax=Salinisphaera japonica YTM-1 TaxID=1209778 RepID=A0A423PLC5_9GAMM|nr:hypothetical protein SAJA_11320 [Salinisphaera japonica YTM-1]
MLFVTAGLAFRHTTVTARVLTWLCLLAAIVWLAGCATRDVDALTAPAVTLPDKFDLGGTAPLANAWWQAFDDPGLDQLIDYALTHNFTVAAAYARLQQAEATVKKSRAGLFPTLSGTASESVFRRPRSGGGFSGFNGISGGAGGGGGAGGIDPSLLFGGGGGNDRSPWSNQESLGLSASYEVDLFGRIRNGLKADKLTAEAQEAALQSAAVTLAGNIASQWYQYQQNVARVKLLESQIETNQNVLELTTFSFNNGQAAAADVLRQRRTVAGSRAQLAQAEAQVQVARHALAVLVGRSSSLFEPPAGQLVDLPALPATGVPSTTLMRRPDVRQAYYTVASSSAAVAVAIADRFPQLSLSANYSGDNSNNALFSNWILRLGAQLTQPIFDAGLRAAEVDRTKAVVDENVADYQQTLVEALQEVDDALINEDRQQVYLKRLREQLDTSENVVANLRLRYLRGATDYLDVLDALLTQQQLQLDLLTGRYQLLDYRINLYRALAGPIDDRPIGPATDNDAGQTTASRPPRVQSPSSS